MSRSTARLTPLAPLDALASLAALFLASTAPPVSGQIGPIQVRPAAGRAVAIEGCRIVTGTGTTYDDGTILLRDDRIEAVGPGIEVPFDAVPFDARGLVAYPGFLDALVVQEAVPGEGRDDEGPAADLTRGALAAFPEANRKGLRADRRASLLLDVPGESLDALRRAGFTAALVAPPRNLLAGTGAVASLSGAPRRTVILAPSAGMFCHPDTGGGEGYPATLLGRLALLRQTFLDARRHRKLLDAAREGSAADARTPVDPQLEALFPVLDRAVPLVIEARSETRIRRAVALARELGARPMLAGGQEAWRAAALLRDDKVPVLLAVDFPKEPEGAVKKGPKGDADANEEKKPDGVKGKTKAQPGAGGGSKGLEGHPAMIPLRVLAWQHQEWVDRVSTAAKLHEAGVPVALTADGAPPDKFLEHLRWAMRQGLSEEAAVEALTRGAAEILGVAGRLGTLERGKAAHVTLLDGPLGSEKSRVRAVFIDGVAHDFRDGEPAPPAKDLDLTGTWDFTATFPAQRFEARLRLEMQPSGKLEGTLEGDTLRGTLEGRVSGTKVTFAIHHEKEGQSVTWHTRGDVGAGFAVIEGSLTTVKATVPWTARRRPREGDPR